jgi:hypothetical protein
LTAFSHQESQQTINCEKDTTTPLPTNIPISVGNLVFATKLGAYKTSGARFFYLLQLKMLVILIKW